MNPRLLILGLGNRMRGDDAIGLMLTAMLQTRPDVDLRLCEETDALTLAHDLIEHDGPVLAVDCADMGIAAGEHRLFPATEARLACKARGLSTHGIGLADGLALAEALGRRGETWVFGVQPADTDLRDGLSPALSHRLPALAAALADAVRQLTETTANDVTG